MCSVLCDFNCAEMNDFFLNHCKQRCRARVEFPLATQNLFYYYYYSCSTKSSDDMCSLHGCLHVPGFVIYTNTSIEDDISHHIKNCFTELGTICVSACCVLRNTHCGYIPVSTGKFLSVT